MKLRNFKKDYNAYFDRYLNNLNEEDDCFEKLKENGIDVFNFFEKINEDKFSYSYAENKWTIGEVLQHIIDTERIFCYRALKNTREENPEIKPYDHDAYAQSYKYVPKKKLLNDYENNRNSTISFYKTLDEWQLKILYKTDYAVGLIPFIICGHELHHLSIIEDRYF